MLSVTFASAQDVIVKKDGTKIESKVMEVGESEVKYKKYSNQNGPLYTISTRDLQCINYEDGSKDTFVSPNYNPTIVTNETASQFSNDQSLLKGYYVNQQIRKGRALKGCGWSLCGAGLIVGVVVAATCCDGPEDAAIWISPMAASVAVGLPMIIVGNRKIKSTRELVQSSHLYQHEFNITKNDRLMVGVDMLRDNKQKYQTLGLGISYNF